MSRSARLEAPDRCPPQTLFLRVNVSPLGDGMNGIACGPPHVSVGHLFYVPMIFKGTTEDLALSPSGCVPARIPGESSDALAAAANAESEVRRYDGYLAPAPSPPGQATYSAKN